MKIQILVLASLLSTASMSFAAGKVVAKCSNGEETSVRIVQVAANSYRADVTVQSTGDSYPTYHFKNVELQPTPPRMLGAPRVYKGNGFEISIQYDAMKAPAVLDVPSLGIEKDRSLTCR